MRSPVTIEEWFLLVVLCVVVPLAVSVMVNSWPAIDGALKFFLVTPGLKKRLLNQDYRLLLNPVHENEKVIRFEAGGKITRGQSDEEHAWRIRRGQLEILNLQGDTHSRFRFNASRELFEHTNDQDTISIGGQVLKI